MENHIMSRRQSLGALACASVPSAALISTAGFAALTDTAQEDPLIDLERRWQIVLAEAAEAAERVKAIEETLEEWIPPGCWAPRPTDPSLSWLFCGVASGQSWMTASEIIDFNCRTESIVAGWQFMPRSEPKRAELRKEWMERRSQGRARLRYYESKCAEAVQIRESSGLNAAEDALEVLNEKADKLEMAMVNTPATSLAGIIVKLRHAIKLAIGDHSLPVLDDNDLDWTYRPTASALRDAERLAGLLPV